MGCHFRPEEALERAGRGTAGNSAAAAGKASGRRARGQPRAPPKQPGAATWDVERPRRHSRQLTLGQVQFPRSSCQHALDLDRLILLRCVALRRSNAAAATHSAARPAVQLGRRRRPAAALLTPAAECAAAIASALLPAPCCCWRRCCWRGRACPRLASRPAGSAGTGARGDPSCRHVGQVCSCRAVHPRASFSCFTCASARAWRGQGPRVRWQTPTGARSTCRLEGAPRLAAGSVGVWQRCATGGSVPGQSGVVVSQMSSGWAALPPSSAAVPSPGLVLKSGPGSCSCFGFSCFSASPEHGQAGSRRLGWWAAVHADLWPTSQGSTVRQSSGRAQARQAPVFSSVCCSSARAMLAAAMPAMAPHIMRACHGAVNWCQTLRQGAGQHAAPSLRGRAAAAPTAAGSKPTSSTAGGVAPCNCTWGCCATTLRARSDCWASRGAGRCRSDSTKPLLDRPPLTWCCRVFQQCDQVQPGDRATSHLCRPGTPNRSA